MSTDTRPSVTVIGELQEWWPQAWTIELDDLPDIGLEDGDEVEVTIRKHERVSSIWPVPEEADE